MASSMQVAILIGAKMAKKREQMVETEFCPSQASQGVAGERRGANLVLRRPHHACSQSESEKDSISEMLQRTHFCPLPQTVASLPKWVGKAAPEDP